MKLNLKSVLGLNYETQPAAYHNLFSHTFASIEWLFVYFAIVNVKKSTGNLALALSHRLEKLILVPNFPSEQFMNIHNSGF